jgi:hypothetical protein
MLPVCIVSDFQTTGHWLLATGSDIAASQPSAAYIRPKSRQGFTS